MPTPLLHSAVGIAIVRASARGRLSWRAFAAGAIVAMFPDFDLLPGMLMGAPLRFHHGVTHSILFAATAAWAASRVGWEAAGEVSARRRFLTLFAVALSHPGLDLFNYRATTPLFDQGAMLPLWWPLETRVHPFIRVFESAPIPPDWRLWFSSTFFGIILREALIAAVLCFLAWRLPGREEAAAPADGRLGAES